MGRNKIDKGKEFRPRLHDGMDPITSIGRFLIVKMDSEEQADFTAKQKIFIRPDRKKGPVRVA